MLISLASHHLSIERTDLCTMESHMHIYIPLALALLSWLAEFGPN